MADAVMTKNTSLAPKAKGNSTMSKGSSMSFNAPPSKGTTPMSKGASTTTKGNTTPSKSASISSKGTTSSASISAKGKGIATSKGSGGKSKGGGNTGLPFGICEGFGIKLGEGATPKDAWNALKDKQGITPDNAHSAIGHLANNKREQAKASGAMAQKTSKANAVPGQKQNIATKKATGPSGLQKGSAPKKGTALKSWGSLSKTTDKGLQSIVKHYKPQDVVKALEWVAKLAVLASTGTIV